MADVIERDGVPVVDFDHHSPEFAAVAEERWKELRESCPVAWSKPYDGFWVVSDYEGNHEVLKHTDRFTSERWPAGDTQGTSFIPKSGAGTGKPTLPLEVDPPDHILYRQLLNPLLSPKASEALKPRMEYWTTRYIDAVIETGRCDLVYDLTSPVPAAITLEWLGYPLEHAEVASRGTHDTLGFAPGSEEFQIGMASTQKAHGYLRQAIAERRKERRDDVISYLMGQEVDGRPVDDDTIFNLAVVLVGGGVDTTTSLTSSALMHLNHDRELRQRLIDDPDLLTPATEEFLRVYPPLTTIARTARVDTDLGGCPVHAGDRILVSRHGANLDPKQFDDPDHFVADRFPNRHVSFGLGPHRCVGSHLARLMFRQMITQILERMPDYEIDESKSSPYPDRGFAQGWVGLPARFTPGTRTSS